jgi:hypothetical protein
MRTSLVALALLWSAACAASPSAGTSPSSSPSSTARSTADSRVRSFRGQVPPELAPDARWLNAPRATLASLRGRVVFVQFAFPT